MAHSYFNDSETPNLYGTRSGKRAFGKSRKKFNLANTKSKMERLRKKMRKARTSGPIADMGKMYTRTSDPLGRR